MKIIHLLVLLGFIKVAIGSLRRPTRSPTTSIPTLEPTTASPTVNTWYPTAPPTQAIICSPYSTSNTGSTTQNFAVCYIFVCPNEVITASGCGPGACTGDQYLTLVNGNFTLVASNDNGGSSCGTCSSLQYPVSGTTCETYELHQGCYGDTACSGTITVTITPIVRNSPTFAPTAAVCTSYAASDTNSASVNFASCYMHACPGNTVSISGCGGGSACSEDQYITLFDSTGTMVSSNDDGGGSTCGSCSALTYTVPVTSSCGIYELREGCYGTSQCGGQFTVLGATIVPNPTSAPTAQPSTIPTRIPSPQPSTIPTPIPSSIPTTPPSPQPTRPSPTCRPTRTPTNSPTLSPTSSAPTVAPTSEPSCRPTVSPSPSPTRRPSPAPTSRPTLVPTCAPTATPTLSPTPSPPSPQPSKYPTASPTSVPTWTPTWTPTYTPTWTPTQAPTYIPTLAPTASPTASPTPYPPTLSPTLSPSLLPTLPPSSNPTIGPTSFPTSSQPTRAPTVSPSVNPIYNPTCRPSSPPTKAPVLPIPTSPPTKYPTSLPTLQNVPYINFQTTVVLGGVSPLAVFQKPSQKALINATATAMGVSPKAVTFVGITSTASSMHTNMLSSGVASLLPMTVEARESEKGQLLEPEFAQALEQQITARDREANSIASNSIRRLAGLTSMATLQTTVSMNEYPKYSDPSTLYFALSTSLTNAVKSGYVQTLYSSNILRSYGAKNASYYGSVSQASTLALTIVYPPTFQPSPYPTASPVTAKPTMKPTKTVLPAKSIIGISVGVVAFVLISLCCFYFCVERGHDVMDRLEEIFFPESKSNAMRGESKTFDGIDVNEDFSADAGHAHSRAYIHAHSHLKEGDIDDSTQKLVEQILDQSETRDVDTGSLGHLPLHDHTVGAVGGSTKTGEEIDEENMHHDDPGVDGHFHI